MNNKDTRASPAAHLFANKTNNNKKQQHARCNDIAPMPTGPKAKGLLAERGPFRVLRPKPFFQICVFAPWEKCPVIDSLKRQHGKKTCPVVTDSL